MHRSTMRPRLFPTLAALFIGLPLLDSLLLIYFGKFLGGWTTFALVIASGLLGAGLAKSQGLRVLQSIQRDLAEGRVPALGLIDAVLILVAGGMLTAPGFVSDVLGLALLIPAVRVPIKAVLRRKAERMIVRGIGF
jgi:UPF0716 protein FxsA